MFSNPHGSGHEMSWQVIREPAELPTEVKEVLAMFVPLAPEIALLVFCEVPSPSLGARGRRLQRRARGPGQRRGRRRGRLGAQRALRRDRSADPRTSRQAIAICAVLLAELRGRGWHALADATLSQPLFHPRPDLLGASGLQGLAWARPLGRGCQPVGFRLALVSDGWRRPPTTSRRFRAISSTTCTSRRCNWMNSLPCSAP